MTWSVENKRILITGGNSGIGKAAAIALVGLGAHVTLTARDPSKGSGARDDIAAATGRDVDLLPLDLADRTSIEELAAEIAGRDEGLHILINNAGAIHGRRRETPEGFELTFATNHLGPFLLTHLLLPTLEASAPARVINVASSGHGFAKEGIRFDDINFEDRYSMMTAYGHSKLANILHASEVNRRFAAHGVTGYSMHPGLVRTNIGKHGDAWLASFAWWVRSRGLITPEEGADTIVWLATADAPEPAGGYFEKRVEARSSRNARDADQARRLWLLSTDLLGIDDDSGP